MLEICPSCGVSYECKHVILFCRDRDSSGRSRPDSGAVDGTSLIIAPDRKQLTQGWKYSEQKPVNYSGGIIRGVLQGNSFRKRVGDQDRTALLG
jgi:hypothetical protein